MIDIQAKFSDAFCDLGNLIGRGGENITRRIVFDCADILTEYPSADIYCVLKRSCDRKQYTVVPEIEGTNRILNLTAYDLTPGQLLIELRAKQGEAIRKSIVFSGRVIKGIQGEPDVPGQPIRDVLDRVENELTHAEETRDALIKALDGVDGAVSSATTAATTANTAADNADTKAGLANTAAEKAQVSADRADASADAADTAAEKAQAAALNADTKATAAATATQNAQTATADAKTATTNANTATDSANTAAGRATTAADAANTAATGANTATVKANQSATNADSAATYANAKATAADTAATNATTAAGKAETAAASANDAVEKLGDADTAKKAAEAARDAAQTSATNAAASETNAATSATTAQTAATNASTSESNVTEMVGTIAHEDTAQALLAEYKAAVVLIKQIIEDGTGGGLNGFNFAVVDGKWVVTYTNPDDETDTYEFVMPTDTTGAAIVTEMAKANDYLKQMIGGTASGT